MKTKAITIVSIIVLLLLGFITNPSKQKHVDNATEILFSDDDLGVLGGLVETFYKPTIAPKVKIDNYYLFSISYLSLKHDNKRMNLGLGLYGQILPIVDENDLNRFKNDDTNITNKTNPSNATKAQKELSSEEKKQKLNQLMSEDGDNQQGTLNGSN